MKITKDEARRFILRKQGLLGTHIFTGKQGALDYIRNAGCIQYDPVDVCGKNADLTLQSRVKGYRKDFLQKLLYEDRALFDYTDKQLSIIPTEVWPYYDRYRRVAREGGKKFEGLSELEEQVKTYIGENGAVCAEELPLTGKMFWHSSINWSGSWSGESNTARSVLEQLYTTGELIVHHKKGTRKYYDLASRYLPAELLAAPEPLRDDFEHQKWRIARRVGAVGLVWDKISGFWNNVWELNTESRHRAFKALLEDGTLNAVNVEGFKPVFYYLSTDTPLLDEVLSGVKFKPRCELIAPLDPFMWDKNLIDSIFDFVYRWEIYTPDKDRKFGAYVLPILYGNRFIGRVEAINDRKAKTLIIKNLWYEDGLEGIKTITNAVDRCLLRFAKFNDCEELERQNK